ncbi:glycosyltransferase family 4 protein [Thiohalocapsa marina]|uniref:Glycosyltransferase family 4 protein n=1 Tax=Thiohalocapsa marina TaxID=424902 RepID=A0A5M8FQK7_9GAMM|nr:glycosyltransferase family 4 protein [Thiohalocapsa marina]KAA6186096.1 glycosyltransferase family 4 protein [Thiohalocapsa marina]
MRVCLVATEFLGWGNAGGFGFATRSLARGLSAQGIDVRVVLPQPRGTVARRVLLDGVEVLAYQRLDIAAGTALLADANADVYHSQEPSLGTWLAQRARPDRLHLVTSRDPRMARDWWQELRYPTYSPLQVLRTAAYYENPPTRWAVRRAAAIYVPARFLIERVARKYRLETRPRFLPTPIQIPARVEKAAEPTVCFVGRLDRRKRPERFFALAAAFPQVRFIVAGAAQDPRFAAQLARLAPPNLDQRGFVDQFAGEELSEILGHSWVLVNTSAREGLPNSFIEACAHRCAILSPVDPDGFANRFGAVVEDGDFVAGLHRLLDDGRWRVAGEAGYSYVVETNDFDRAVNAHIHEYQRLLAEKRL